MARKKQPAKVWIEDNLIKIKPFKTNEVYFLDYSEEVYEVVEGKRWTCWGRPYPMAWINGGNVLLHHLVLPSKYKEGLLVDHINRDTRDNRKENLRYVSRFESGINRGNMSDNKSGHKGVFYRKDKRRWVANISINGTRKQLGSFMTKKEAIKARVKAEEKYYPGIVERN